MDLEAPMDGWYVWVGVAVVSIGLLGFAGGLPSSPPPDAERAAAAIDRVAASEYDAGATLEHDAEMVRVGPERIAMRSEAGTARARTSFERILTLWRLDLTDTERRTLRGVLAGERLLPDSLEATLATAIEDLETATGEWRPAEGTLRARAVSVDGTRIVLVVL